MRQKKLGYFWDNYLNLIRFLRQTAVVDLQDEAVATRLRKEISATKSLAERKLLLEQFAHSANNQIIK